MTQPQFDQSGEIVFRQACDADADGVIALVAVAYAEYPGCVFDL